MKSRMPAVAFLVYLLLSVPVYGRAEAFSVGTKGTAVVQLRAAGCALRYETALTLGRNGWPLRPSPVPGAPDKKRETDAHSRLRRIMVSALRSAVRAQRISAAVRVGTGDAWSTALAVGAARSALCGAISALPGAAHRRVDVTPDFAACGFCMHLCCIFSLTAGDIILEAAGAAIKKKRKEGMRCSSIPSRA